MVMTTVELIILTEIGNAWLERQYSCSSISKGKNLEHFTKWHLINGLITAADNEPQASIIRF